MPLKFAFIGAGSIGFTRRLMRDLLTVLEFADSRFAFTDIDARNLNMISQLCRRDIEGNGLPATAELTLDRRAALAGADYVFASSAKAGWRRSRPISTPAQVRRGPVRRRHALRGRSDVRAAHDPGPAGHLQGYPRGRQVRRNVFQLCTYPNNPEAG